MILQRYDFSYKMPSRYYAIEVGEGIVTAEEVDS